MAEGKKDIPGNRPPRETILYRKHLPGYNRCSTQTKEAR